MLLVPASASAATWIGTVPGSDGTSGGCSPCIALQSSTDPGDPSYAFSAAGAISRYVFWAGSSVSAGATVRVQVYRQLGGNAYRLVAQSADYSYGSTGGLVQVATRVPVAAGDVLGLRLNHTSANTPLHFDDPSAHAANVVGTDGSDPAVGDTVSVTANATRFANVAASVEPDADGDGYGDETQDLCPGNGGANVGACSGVLVGDALQSSKTADLDCPVGPDCSVIQTAAPSRQWTAPFDGVILRWRVKDGDAGHDYKLRVFRSTGLLGQLKAVAETSQVTDADADKIAHGATRIGVKAGDQLGLSGTGDFPYSGGAGANSVFADPDPALLSDVTTADTSNSGAFLYNADIEPDADHDLWGDLTEDACTTDATRRDDCTAPTISGFSLSNTRFVVDNRGAVVAKRMPKGTKFSLSSNEAAKLKFKIERATKGQRSRQTCKKPKKPSKSRSGKKPCTRWDEVHKYWIGDVAAGPVSAPYSGRFKAGKRTKRLAAGKYRVSAFAWDANNNLATTTPIEFYVAASPKSRSSK